MKYRRFVLVNSKGQKWDLSCKNIKAFLSDPQGLGFANTLNMVQYGEKLNVTSESHQFPNVQGTILFFDSKNENRYELYHQFMEFISHKPLKLYYAIPTELVKTYHIDCYVTQLQKTESKEDKILSCSVTFGGLSFWQGDAISIAGSGATYTLNNEGHFPVGFEITIEGDLTNPYVTLSQDGELYGEAKFDSETAFSSVYVNSNDGEQNVVLMQNDAIIPNPLSYQDLSISNGSIYVTFVKLARGESTLTIGMDSGSVSNVTVVYTPQYRSV